MSLEKILIAEINQTGPLSVERYMEACLYNDEFGYYTTKENSIGQFGDFITSPEVSQVFGELIGLWMAQSWIDRGSPNPFNLVELGPGNGTLMNDILRTIKNVPRFLEFASVFFVETSKTLRARQRKHLKGFNVKWLETLDAITDQPTFIIANEFFDALPIRQFIKFSGVWNERCVGLDKQQNFCFCYSPSKLSNEMKMLYADVPDNVLVEVCDTAKKIISALADKIDKNNGVALLIDYGRFGGTGDTFQAVRDHSYSDPLLSPGKSDLTAQVDFKTISEIAKKKGLRATNLCDQGYFLESLGIKLRSISLAKKMKFKEKNLHFQAIDGLTSKDEMGGLFKIMALTTKSSPLLPILEKL